MRTYVVSHPAEIFRQPELTEVHKADWTRLRRLLTGHYPTPLPTILQWEATAAIPALYAGVPYLVVDCEWVPDSGDLMCLGMGAPGLPIVQWWPRHDHAELPMRVAATLARLFRAYPVVFHNAMADIPVIEHHLGLGYEAYRKVEDSLFLHALLWTELPHDLEFLDSVYGSHEKRKHLPVTDPRYNAGDVASTLCVWAALTKEVARDPGVRWVYENSLLPLIPIILQAQAAGIRIDRDKVTEVQGVLEARLGAASAVAQAVAGWPINLGSQGEAGQVARLLAHDFKRKITSVDDEHVARLRAHVLPYDPLEEDTTETMLARIESGGHPILEARVLYARSQQYLSHYIQPMLASSDSRVYPRFLPWTQHTGRWSTVDPPLAQLPHDLREALLPDPGWLWVEWDWSNLELRLVAYLARDHAMIAALEKGLDLHTLNMCEFFGYPKPFDPTKEGIQHDLEWTEQVKYTGGDDARRVFAKRAVFRLCYGGTPEGAPAIPGARKLGLTDDQLVSASRRWIAAHPAIKRFWNIVLHQGLRSRTGRTIFGRRWCFLGHDVNRIKRQLYDLPMQGAVSELMNLTLINVHRALGTRMRLAYTMHDSVKMQLLKGPRLAEDLQTIHACVHRTWDIDGQPVVFPADIHTRG